MVSTTATMRVYESVRRYYSRERKAFDEVPIISIEVEGSFPVNDGNDTDDGIVWVDFDDSEDAVNFANTILQRVKEIKEARQDGR